MARKGFVYFIQAGKQSGPVKVGWAVNPTRRLADLQIANPVELRLLASCPGALLDEQDLHRVLARYCIRGEWFALPPALLRPIKRFCKRGDPASDLMPMLRELGRDGWPLPSGPPLAIGADLIEFWDTPVEDFLADIPETVAAYRRGSR